MAMYNNGFPINYQPAQIYYPQQYQQPQQVSAQTQQPQTQNNSIIWVQGEAGAKSYLVAPNTTVQLWDSEEQVIYLKSADASGMPSMKILDYRIRESTQPTQQIPVINNNHDYVTRDELTAFEEQIKQQIAGLSVSRTRTKKEEKIDE